MFTATLETLACPLMKRPDLSNEAYERGLAGNPQARPGRLEYREELPVYNRAEGYTCTSCRRRFGMEETRQLARLRGIRLVRPARTANP